LIKRSKFVSDSVTVKHMKNHYMSIIILLLSWLQYIFNVGLLHCSEARR